MGIWSKPLFTRCTGVDGKPVDNNTVLMTFAKDDGQERIYNLRRHGADVTQGTRTFDAAIMSIHDCATIWGYFEKAELQSWEQFFTRLLEQNSHVKKAEAHFFCCDEGFPFVIYKKRGERFVRIQHGTEGHCMYSVLNYDDQGNEWKFDVEMYAKARDEHKKVFWSAMKEYCDLILLYKTGQSYPR